MKPTKLPDIKSHIWNGNSYIIIEWMREDKVIYLDEAYEWLEFNGIELGDGTLHDIMNNLTNSKDLRCIYKLSLDIKKSFAKTTIR